MFRNTLAKMWLTEYVAPRVASGELRSGDGHIMGYTDKAPSAT